MIKPSDGKQIVKIANFGCGVNSVAGVLKYGIDAFDEIVFADTGNEKPETYKYLDFLINEKNWKISVVGKDYHWNKNIYDYYIERKSFPNAAFRDCTGKFKIEPMKRYLRKKYGKKVHFDINLFIDYSEIFRMRDAEVLYQTLVYPLINDKIDRDDCVKIIQDSGYPIPPKSSCFFCPFNTPKQWLELKDKHPELFEKAVKLENIRGKIRKKEYRLINLKETLKDGNQSCLTGYCMT